MEEPDHWDRRLLRPRRERPRRRAAEQGDELALASCAFRLNPRIGPYHIVCYENGRVCCISGKYSVVPYHPL